MIDKCKVSKAEESVVGVFQQGRTIHTLVKDPSKHSQLPLKTMCGSVFNISYSNPWATTRNISDVTCKKCLRMLKKKALEKDLCVKPKLLGAYAYNDRLPTHALIERATKESDNPSVGVPLLRSMCNALPDIYRSDIDEDCQAIISALKIILKRWNRSTMSALPSSMAFSGLM